MDLFYIVCIDMGILVLICAGSALIGCFLPVCFLKDVFMSAEEKKNKIKTTSIARVKHKAKLNQSMHIQHIRLVNSVEGVCSPSLFHSIIVCSVRGKKTQHC